MASVRRHPRKPGPGGAWRNAKRAWRSLNRKQRERAVIFAVCAAAEIGAWLTLRGTALTLTAVGIVLVGAGLAARRAAH